MGTNDTQIEPTDLGMQPTITLHASGPSYALVPLSSIVWEDITASTGAFDAWLRKISNGYITVERLRGVQDYLSVVPVLSNIMAIVDTLNHIVELIENNGQYTEIEWVVFISDVIGIVPAIGTAAAPLRILFKGALKDFKKIKKNRDLDFSQATYLILESNINESLAGNLEEFVEGVSAQLDGWLKETRNYIAELLDLLSSLLLQLSKIKPSEVSMSDEIMANASKAYVPDQPIRNFFRLLSAANRTVLKEAGTQIWLAAISEDTKQSIQTYSGIIQKNKGPILSKITQLSDKSEVGSVPWYLEQIKAVVKAKSKNKKRGANVKSEGTDSQNTKPQEPIGSINKQEKAKDDANPCKNNCKTAVGGAISIVSGRESFSHVDAEMSSILPLVLERTYASNFTHLKDSEFGAQWITSWSLQIVPSLKDPKKLQLITLDYRLIDLEDIQVGQKQTHLIEDFVYLRDSEEKCRVIFSNEMTYHFFKAGTHHRVEKIVFKNGNVIDFKYIFLNTKCCLSEIIASNKDKTFWHVYFNFLKNSLVHKVYLKDEVQDRCLAVYDYDHNNNLVSATNEFGYRYQYNYADQHLITRYTDLTGRGMNIEWDHQHQPPRACHEWADDGSFEQRFYWHPNLRMTAVENAQGEVTQYWYDILGYHHTIEYPDGSSEWFFRDAAKNITKEVTTSGEVIYHDYDEKSNLLKTVQADGVELYYGYDQNNNLTHFRDGEANIWQREYDEKDHLTAEIDPLEGKTQYQYNPMGLPISIQDAKGGVKQLSYNEQGQLTQYVDCSGKATQWQYDERGRLTQIANALNEITQYKYTELGRERVITTTKEQLHNAIGQLEQVIHADGTIEHFVHDAEGRLLQHTDAQGQSTKYLYNASGLISQRTDSMNKTLKYQWDKLGRLSKLVNENGASYSFHYDVMGRLLREVDFDGKETVYHYEQASGTLQRSIELVQATQTTYLPRHRVQEFEFDAMGRLIQRTAGFSHDLKKLVLEVEDNQEAIAAPRLDQSLTEEFAYDGNGQLIQAKNSHSRIQFFYNEVGNLSHEHHHDLKTQQTAVWKHLYDELNNRITTHRPDGQKVDWLLYGSGHVYGLSLGGEDTVSFKRDDLHREIERHYVNGLSQEQRYDKAGRLTKQNIKQGDEAGYQTPNTSNAQQQTTELLRRLYHYDKVGQLTDIHDKRRGHIEYKYDPVGRLLQANSALGKETFAFDPASNIINPNKQYNIRQQDTYFEPIHQNIGYNHLVNNVVKDYLNQKYTYDEFGQLVRQIEGDVLYFEWDALGRLIRSKDSDQETHYRYDALGRRIEKAKQKARRQGMTETTYYGWDGDTLAYESTSQYTKHYVYEKDSFIPLIQATYRQQIKQHQTPQWPHGYDYDVDPLWHEDKPAEKFDRVWFYHCDHLGTPQEMSDQTGAIVWTAQYKAWGECKSENHVKRDIWDSEIITNNIRFQGQYFDEETGLHYNRYRYYSPYVGRFISKDPIGLLGGSNVYAYAPNPVGWIDPLGLNGFTLDGKGNSIPIDKYGIPDSKLFEPNPNIKATYSRPQGTPISKQTAEVASKACVVCGTANAKQVADHKDPLVVEYWRTGTNDMAHQNSTEAVQAHCAACSRVQGGKASAFSKAMKKKMGL